MRRKLIFADAPTYFVLPKALPIFPSALLIYYFLFFAFNKFFISSKNFEIKIFNTHTQFRQKGFLGHLEDVVGPGGRPQSRQRQYGKRQLGQRQRD